jgi:hypothetical protein
MSILVACIRRRADDREYRVCLLTANIIRASLNERSHQSFVGSELSGLRHWYRMYIRWEKNRRADKGQGCGSLLHHNICVMGTVDVGM